MKTICIFLAVSMLIACESAGNNDNVLYDNYLEFPEAPVEIMSNNDESSSEYDCSLINYFNILKVDKNLYYMWYAAFGAHSGESDINQGLYFAYSSDATHWTRKMPDGRSNAIQSIGIQEQSVFRIDSDKENPYRLIANVKESGRLKLCMWKSSNGYDYDLEDYKVLLEEGYHDTQNVIIPRKDALFLYTRAWNPALTNRRIGLAKYNAEGEMVSPIDTIGGNYLYNSAASYVNEEFDLLVPTYMNNREGENKSDDAYPKSYLNSESGCVEIPNNLGKWLKNKERWLIVAPGLIDIDGKKYIAYNTREWSHDSKKPEGGISRYYLIRVKLYANGKLMIE